MIKKLFFFLITVLLHLNTSAFCSHEVINPDSINDGPYIYKVGKKLIVKWIENNELKVGNITPRNFNEVKEQFNLLFNYDDIAGVNNVKSNFSQDFTNIDSIGVITDIHGAYDRYLNLLKAMGIIDKNLNWSFGKGHLVVLGDIFDRGDKVTEVLWHLFGLEKQAAKAGGKVHVMWGNHGLMVLNNDVRYINEKYVECESISLTDYPDFFSEKSVLGEWLRNKPVVVTIDDILFVHAGLSIDMIKRGFKVNQINQIFSEKIIGKDIEWTSENEELLFLTDENGPLWYRGYFNDNSFNESRLDSILTFYDKKHIVVGHTAHDDIISLFNNKIFGVDAGLMNGKPGEMLIYKNGIFYKGLITGERIRF